MDEYQSGEETTFIVDEVSGIIKESIETAIGGNAYQPSRVNQWTTSVVELCLSQLTKLGKPFKYIDKSLPLFSQSNQEYKSFGRSGDLNWKLNDICDNAEEWSWSAHSKFLLLGQQC
ncbi:dynein light chain Tctex-type 1-like isoform X3 [Narcine bancroftii]|uniref:dynein light chain Tctex-type 1-like isoform X3 n=1 Tax=Narcine bancroftii TaxID=1343680 RepID=UPI0038315C7E